MHLVQLLIPMYDNRGEAFPALHYARLRDELATRFGGLTAYTRAPAHGVWAEDGTPQHDDILVHEVMVEELDRTWWRDYRRELEARFAQDELVIRAQQVERL
jgi:hypothetical protein